MKRDTIRRPAPTYVRLLRNGMGFFSPRFPAAAGAVAERLFFTPPQAMRAMALPPGGEPVVARVGGRRIAAWSWGQGPSVLLVHGWGGRASQFASIVFELRARGRRVVAFDAPGHGRSGRGRTSPAHFAWGVEAVVDAIGDIEGVIAHSIGGPAVAVAAHRGLTVRRAVFIAPAEAPSELSRRFADAFDVAPAAMAAMKRRAEARLRMRFEDFEIARPDRALGFDLLVIHDRQDREASWRVGAAVAKTWPRATFELTHGLGHGRILKDEGVVGRAVDFVTNTKRRAPADVASTSHWLERHLYDRDCRHS